VSIHVALTHVTEYRYDRAVMLGPQVVRLRPAPHARTRVLSYSLRVEPARHFINWQQDPQSNYQARLVFPERTRQLRIEVDLVVEMAVFNPFDFFLEPEAEQFPFAYDQSLATELAPFLACEPPGPRLAGFLETIPRETGPTIDRLVTLNQRLQAAITYLIRHEPGVQTPEQTLELGSGSCRDSAWLLVQILRHLGLAARFASGYLIQLAPDVKSLDGPSGPTADFTDLHAWCEVFLPGAGWIGLDPTSGLLAGEGHIPLACTPEPGSAAPISGGLEACEAEFTHAMQVSRVAETPRVTRPYTEAQWAAIDRLGHAVDADLASLDVRLTQGGEPTFVSIDDRDAPEWNTEALGEAKRARADQLMERLRSAHAPQGLLHHGQGKWYPGEQLPRWSLNLFWRRDGLPVWRDPALIATGQTDADIDESVGGSFLAAVARRLGVSDSFVFEAFEDAWYYLWRERRLPANVDPFDSRLSDPQERERLRRIFMRGLDRIAGHVLPLARAAESPGLWISGPWFLREQRCYLMPGDSPLGFRLPIDSQPWVEESAYPFIHPRDPADERPPLPGHEELGRPPALRTRQTGRDGTTAGAVLRNGRDRLSGRTRDARPAPFESASWITRTALCAEVRQGILHLFMPPLSTLEDYLALVATIEAVAAELQVPVRLEGYEPPRDERLHVLRVTPDPGVIEVNVQPVDNWSDLVSHTTFLYEAAHQSRLSSEKFMLDGRHAGTGGGNHVVFGGATPADSPFLRRPDLLASMIAWWHNHPSLSWLFSGLFIGPTSQAPRIDEARHESVYEMEIALAQIAGHSGSTVPPWFIDRTLRNLLVDLTGNTHRAEFCIDKLYSPDSATGRLGLLEMRGFEMPPHAHMSLAQQLLIRALIARFWQRPYRPARLQRWGAGLHDRYMLPWFIWQDFNDVLHELDEAGYRFDPQWFAPHFEFRFPLLGDYALEGVGLELRMALEPWPVMGEEGSAGGTVRLVDSSLERVQVRVSGWLEGRYQLACNGRPVPLAATGRTGEFVAGVRYRAWSQATSLHPGIGRQAPLTFDLIDTWSGRSMGGCQYHVAHPGGRNHDTFPVNAFEAEARRLARFNRFGHTPGPVTMTHEQPNPVLPFTLDLRRSPPRYDS
jgi:uncharacterized protein (DUF2126 family)/transglutaminase-like putative cysteine protease